MPKPIVPSEPTSTPAKAACKADDSISRAVVVAAAYIVAAVIVAISLCIGQWLNGN
jgi:hypothetical protein